jgi:hypothetical protein
MTRKSLLEVVQHWDAASSYGGSNRAERNSSDSPPPSVTALGVFDELLTDLHTVTKFGPGRHKAIITMGCLRNNASGKYISSLCTL